MKLGGRVWNTLDSDDRKSLIISVYPNRAKAIVELESTKKWDDLMPSTQEDLLDADWSMILGRDVSPDGGGVWFFHCDDL